MWTKEHVPLDWRRRNEDWVTRDFRIFYRRRSETGICAVGKLKSVMAISEILAGGGGRNACGSGGSMKSGLVKGGNTFPNPFAPKWKIVDEKNMETMT
jgi:hypothetical protein